MGRSDGCKENPSVNGAANGKNKNKPLNVHYFSTFFWSKLEKEGYEKGRLAKWTKKVSVARFSCFRSGVDRLCRLIYSPRMLSLSLSIITIRIGRELRSTSDERGSNHTTV